MVSSTTIPRSQWIPADCASSILGRIPTAITTRSVSISVPFLKTTFSTRFLPSIAAVSCDIRKFSPLASNSCNIRSDAGLSNCWFINTSAICTTVTSIPWIIKPLAASKPSKPPPITTAFLWDLAVSSMVSTSAISRKLITPGKSRPGKGNINGREPVASNRRS